MRFLLNVERGLKSVERVFCYVAAGLVFVMIFPTTVDVVLRYVFNAPLPEMFQLTEFMMVGVVYLGIAYVQQLKDHIKIEIATEWMPRKGQDILDLFGHFVGLFIFGLITWQTGRQAWEAWDTQDYTMGLVQFPLWPAKSLLPLGIGLFCLRLFLDLLIGICRLAGSEAGGEKQAEGER